MFGRIALSLVLAAGGTLAAQAPRPLPVRPEQLSFPPLAFQVPRAKDHKLKLRNGIPVYLSAEATSAPMIRLTLHWRGGAYLEPAGKEGLAQIFGSQLAQGGSARLTALQVEERLEDLAASLSSACGETSGSLSLQAQTKDFTEVFGLFMDALTRPAFAQDRLDLAKRTQRQALERRNDAVTSIAGYQMGHLLRGEDHFTVKDATAASLEAITREDLQAFHGRLLHPANLVVSVSGRFDRKGVLDALNAALGRLQPGPGAVPSPRPPAPAFERRPGLYVVDKAAPQAMVQWAFPGLRRTDPEWHAAEVMNHILGGSFTGRLMKKIRSDEGLTYGIRTTLGDGAYWTGDLMGASQTSNRTVAYLLRLALAEMEKLKAEPLTEAELKAIKEGLIESFPSRWGKSAAVGTLAEEALAGWPEDWWVTYREKIQAVSPAEVQRMARKLLDPGKLVLLAVGLAAEMEAGDPDHPGALKDVAALPLVHLPLRDPLTRQPLK